jgi:hypothetical protein
MNGALTMILVSFITANLPSRHIRLYLALLLMHVKRDGPLTVIDITFNILNQDYARAHLNIDMSPIFQAEIWAIRHNRSVLKNHCHVLIR